MMEAAAVVSGEPLPWRCMGCSRPLDELLVMPCTHRFCGRCMDQWLDADCMRFVVNKQQVACWFCWTVWQIPPGGMVAYMRSWTLERLQCKMLGMSMVDGANDMSAYRPVSEAKMVAANLLQQIPESTGPPREPTINGHSTHANVFGAVSYTPNKAPQRENPYAKWYAQHYAATSSSTISMATPSNSASNLDDMSINIDAMASEPGPTTIGHSSSVPNVRTPFGSYAVSPKTSETIVTDRSMSEHAATGRDIGQQDDSVTMDNNMATMDTEAAALGETFGGMASTVNTSMDIYSGYHHIQVTPICRRNHFM